MRLSSWSSFFGKFSTVEMNYVLKKECSSPEVCFKREKDTLSDYQRWNDLKQNQKKPHREKTKWSKPNKGCIKLNFDASLNSQQDALELKLLLVTRTDMSC